MAHSVTFIPGDGTGPELAEATRRVLEATGVEFVWDEQPAGEDVYAEEGDPFPERTLESIKRTGVGIKGPTTTPVGSGFRSINVQLRKELDLYCCIRPCKLYEGVRSHFDQVDIVIVRENTGDLYQADLGVRQRADRRGRLRLRGAQRSPQGDGGPQSEHHEVLRWPLPCDGARSRRAPPRDRVRGPDHRQPLQSARVPTRGVRRDRPPKPLRGHRFRPRSGDDRRPRPRPGRQRRHRGGDVRGHPRVGAEVQGHEQGQPHGADALGGADAAPPRRDRGRRPDGERDRGRDPRGRERDLRPEARPRRPDRGRHLGVRRRGDRGDAGHDLPARRGRSRVSDAVRVTVTGAAGQIGYAILFRIASGQLLGADTLVHLSLLALPDAAKAAEGAAMELEDCAFPMLAGTDIHDDPMAAFEGANIALLIGARPRTKGMERSDLLEANGGIFKPQGEAINEGAADDVKVLVVGNPANTNCLIAMSNAPDVPRERFTAMTRLDHNRAVAQLAKKTGATVSDIRHMTIWGNHSTTQYPDLFHCKVNGRVAAEVVDDQAWLENEFIPTVAKRGAAIIEARGASSAASAANAAIDHVRDWVLGTAEGDWVSMAVCSDGSYSVEEGLISSFPCTCANGEWTVVQGLDIDAFSRERIDASVNELKEERDAVKQLELV